MERTQKQCQVCARPIRIKNGLISHHGYRQFKGARSYSCHGARRLPYECAHDALDEDIVVQSNALDSMIESETTLKSPNGAVYVRWIEAGASSGGQPLATSFETELTWEASVRSRLATGLVPEEQFDELKRKAVLLAEEMRRQQENWVKVQVSRRKHWKQKIMPPG